MNFLDTSKTLPLPMNYDYRMQQKLLRKLLQSGEISNF